MRIDPLTTAVRPRPVALALPGHRRLVVLTADGQLEADHTTEVRRLLERLKRGRFVIFTLGGLVALKHVTDSREWTCHTWRGHAVRMVHEPTGCRFTSTRGTLDDTPEVALGDLLEVVSWLHDYGVGAGPVSTVAWHLFRASLAEPVKINCDPRIARPALFGGRQQATIRLDDYGQPKTYSNMVTHDIRRAYPHAMGARPYGLDFRRVSPSTDLDPTCPGLALARVIVPDARELTHAPLPVRVAPRIIQFPHGRIEGTWTWLELSAAARLGCDVTVRSCWAPRTTVDLFAGWWPIALDSDTLSTLGARTLAKAMTTALWGHFAMNGHDSGITRWRDPAGREPYRLNKPARHLPHERAVCVAVETTSRVRTRLLLEGLYGDRKGQPVHADTDGVIVRGGSKLPSPSGDAPGHWREKERMRRLEIRAPQLYRSTCGQGCGVTHARWHYTAAGVRREQAVALFEARWRRPPTEVAYRNAFDMVLPPGHVDDRERLRRLLAEAHAAGGDGIDW